MSRTTSHHSSMHNLTTSRFEISILPHTIKKHGTCRSNPQLSKRQSLRPSCFFFFLNDPPTPEISTLPLHAAFPIWASLYAPLAGLKVGLLKEFFDNGLDPENERRIREGLAVYEKLGARLHEVSLPNLPLSVPAYRSEEHTSELQSQSNLVCRLLLEK